MRTRKKIYNALIQREKYPPLFRCNRVGYNASTSATQPAAHRQTLCRRVLLFLVVSVLLVPALSSCTQGETEPYGYEPYDPHPTWTDSNPDAFWDKQQGGGFQTDTAWDGDTTINF